MSLLRYLFDHNQQVIGGLMVIILATAAFLAMRMVRGEEKSGTHSNAAPRGAGSDLDLGAIEAAFQRVLAAQTGAPAAVAPAVSGTAVPTGSDEAKIQELAREIDRLTSELNAKGDGGGFGFGGTAGAPAGAPVDNAQLEALNKKIGELEGKLTEYEIIEDDIADLSRFKEENAELRGEIEALKQRTTPASGSVTAKGVATAVAPAAAPAEASPTEASADDAMAALEADLAAASSDLDEAKMKDFASSLEIQKPKSDVATSSDLNQAVAAASVAGSSVLDDSVDTEKMLSEVSSLAESTDHAEDVLSGELDTDKLLAEVGALTPSAAAAPSTPAVASAAAPVPAPAAQPAAHGHEAEPQYEDDLLAEFKDSNDGGQG